MKIVSASHSYSLFKLHRRQGRCSQVSSLARRASILMVLILILFSLQAAHAAKRPIRIGVVSMITPVGTVEYYQDIIAYISEKMGQPVQMPYRKTYSEMDQMLEQGEVDAAFICSMPYVEDKIKFGAELLAVPEVNGSSFYRSLIIVHKDSDIQNFDELRGRSFAFTDPRSNSGRLYPTHLLAKSGLKVEDFFGKFMYSYSHNKSVELVAKKEVDGAAVENLIYKYMQKKKPPYVQQTRIIGQSPYFGIPPLVSTPKTSTFILEKIKEILLNMHKDPEGRKILAAMFIGKFVRGNDSNYDTIREMLSFVKQFYRQEDILSKPAESSIVRLGLIPRDNPRLAYEKFQPLVDYLAEKTPYRFELVLKKTYDDTVTALGEGEIDMAFLGPLTYLHAKAKYNAVSILKSITQQGVPYYHSVIVKKEDSKIQGISDLKGKSFAFSSLKSTSGNLIPRYILAENGIHLRQFKSYDNFNYHDTVVKWVLKGKYDAGAVRESVAEKYLPLGLEIISRSGKIPTGPLVVSPQIPYTVVESIKAALINISKTDQGKDVLKKIGPEFSGGFTETSDFDYEHIRKMINNIPKSCGMGCHPNIQL